jgi:hypothetical protein
VSNIAIGESYKGVCCNKCSPVERFKDASPCHYIASFLYRYLCSYRRGQLQYFWQGHTFDRTLTASDSELIVLRQLHLTLVEQKFERYMECSKDLIRRHSHIIFYKPLVVVASDGNGDGNGCKGIPG